MIEGIFIEGFIFAIMALGVFITFRILDFPDMTVDGSFPMGAVILAGMVSSGYHYVTAIFIAFIGGLIAGSITALIQITLKIHNLLAGILTLTMMYSINLRILGKPNQTLYGQHTLITWIEDISPDWIDPYIIMLFIFGLIIIFIKAALDLFFKTDMGLAMISMGDNPKMVVTLGINDNIMKLIGVSLANGLVAISGALTAIYLNFGDTTMGLGIIITGLASVMIGEFIIKNNSMFAKTLRVIVGCIIYKAVMYIGRVYGYKIGLNANDLKLITGLLIIACLAASRFSITLDKVIPFKKKFNKLNDTN